MLSMTPILVDIKSERQWLDGFNFDLHAVDSAIMPSRVGCTMDCGVILKEFSEYVHVHVELDTSLAENGIILNKSYIADDKRLKLIIFNVGKQIVAIQPSQLIGKLCFVPKFFVNLGG